MSTATDGLPPFDFAARRAQVLDQIGDGIAVFRAPPLAVHANDVEYRYRPKSNFFYLTGFGEADAVAVLDGSAEAEKFVLFVQPRDPNREQWTGSRAGVEGAIEQFGADAAYPMEQLPRQLIPRITHAGALHYRLGHDEAFNHRLLEMAKTAWASRPRTANDQPTSLIDSGPLVYELRLKKSEQEIAWLQGAIDIAAQAHIAALKETRPGQSEYEIEALVEYTFRRRGASGWAYPSIIAGGSNATVLHYIDNEGPLRDGELLLIDAGCELGYYCADITRTFPIGRDFAPAQRRIYDLVLASQEAAIDVVRPGATVDEVHERAVEVLVEGLLSLDLIPGADVATAVAADDYKKFYMHRTSHWLGMDVHDVGAYNVGGSPRPLEPGMVLTVEPGLYFAPSVDGVPDEYRGIGIRIEDDVLVTDDGCSVLSAAVPKQPDEMLALRG
ncbi:MAG: aminopeptidase P N-terminal domain-containing protein [Candidatus Binatia bacterium]|nr:aminopeptidase P N-terminal domain-containing protein [Candidatus Binatia bacterium]